MDIYSSFEKMKMSKDSVGTLKSLKKFTNPLKFGSTTSYWFGCKV